jgi:hypothetical protein
MEKMPKLLRQLVTDRIYIALPALEARSDMVLLDPSEVVLTSGGYKYVPGSRVGLTAPAPTIVEPVFKPEIKDVVIEVDPLEEAVDRPAIVVSKSPYRMKMTELTELAKAIDERFPEFDIDISVKHSLLAKACSSALKKIEALAEQE